MAVITVGNSAWEDSGGYGTSANKTWVTSIGAANDTGIITTVYFSLNKGVWDLKVGSLQSVGTRRYVSRDFRVLGDFEFTGPVAVTGLDFDIVAGDFIGFYCSATDRNGICSQPYSGQGHVSAARGDFFTGEEFGCYDNYRPCLFGVGETASAGWAGKILGIDGESLASYCGVPAGNISRIGGV